MGEAAPCRGYFPQAPIFPGWEREMGDFGVCGRRPEALPLDSASL